MRSARNRTGGGGGPRSGWAVSPNQLASSSGINRGLGRRSEWRHQAGRSRYGASRGALSRGHGNLGSPRRSPSVGRHRGAYTEREQYDDFDVDAAAVFRTYEQRENQSRRAPLSPRRWAARGTQGFDGNRIGDDIHDEFYSEYTRPDTPPDTHLATSARMGRDAELRDFHHRPHHLHSVSGDSLSKMSSSGAEIDDRGRLVQKSIYLDDDGSRRKFLPLPSKRVVHQEELAAIGGVSTGGSLRMGLTGTEEPMYHEYSDEDRGTRIYSREVLPRSSVLSSPRRRPAASSSSSAAREEALHRWPSGGTFSQSSDFKSFRDKPVDHGRYNWTDTLEGPGRGISNAISEKLRGHSFSEYEWELRDDDEEDDALYSESERLYKKARWGSREEYQILESDGLYSPARRVASNGILVSRQRYPEEDTIPGYPEIEMEGDRGEYLGSPGGISFAYRANSSPDGEVLQLGRKSRYGRHDLADYRDLVRSPPLAKRFYSGVFGRTSSPPRDMDMEELDRGKAPEREYVTREDINILRETRNARAVELEVEAENLTDQGRMERKFPPTTRPRPFDHSRLGMSTHRISGSGNWWAASDRLFAPSGSSQHGLKRLPRQDFHDGPQSLRKKGTQDQLNTREIDERHHLKIDPREDSEEFRQQLHKAFLRFSKLLNENPARQEKYRDEGKGPQGYHCYVCGSLSKEFGDTHSLVTHTFHSRKVGLRTEHMGLHKALCVLMGWNWAVPPDTSKSYRTKPGQAVDALKEDLIIWPPVVIIRSLPPMGRADSDILGGAKDAVEKILKGMKVDMGKVKVGGGKAGDKSTLLVKFMPTLSGLQEADGVHKLFAGKKRGKKELGEVAAEERSAEAQAEEEWLYGYMGTVEDLERLDSETKRRCVLKSKREIENIADAPIESRPE